MKTYNFGAEVERSYSILFIYLFILFYYYSFFCTLSLKKSLRCSYANVIKTPIKEQYVPLNLLSSTLPVTCPVVADTYSSRPYRLKINMYYFIRILFILKTLK